MSAVPIEINESQIKEMITQLNILKTKQEGHGMSLHNPSRGNGTPSLNLYGDRAKSAIWLFLNAENIAKTLEVLMEERKADHDNINLKADFIDTAINDLAQRDEDNWLLNDFFKERNDGELVDYLPSHFGKISWNENPLSSVTELTEAGKQYLKLKVIISEFEEWGGYVHYTLIKEDLTLEKAKEVSRFIDSELIDKRVDTNLPFHLDALTSSHCGDCTCVPASCPKCHVESLLGIRTTKGLSKHQATKIADAFKSQGDAVTLDQAIVRLENYNPKATWEGWEAHAPRWEREAKEALLWLTAYKEKHFPDHKDVDVSESTVDSDYEWLKK